MTVVWACTGCGGKAEVPNPENPSETIVCPDCKGRGYRHSAESSVAEIPRKPDGPEPHVQLPLPLPL